MKTSIPKITEAEFLKQVIQLAKLHGWICAHFRPGMNRRGKWQTAVAGDGVGFPDVILLRKGRIIAAELKVGHNKTTAEQDVWLRRFQEAGAAAYVFRPENWDSIESILE